jgi:hypothetical protein
MCNLAAEQTSSWLMVDPWEAFQSYQRTAVVLDHFEHEINDKLGGVATLEGEMRHVKILLLAGSDLIATMSEPGVWSQLDVCSPSLLLGFVITPPRFACSSVGSHSRQVWLLHHRACRVRHGPGCRRLGTVGTQHPYDSSAHSERRLVHQSPPFLEEGPFRKISPPVSSGDVHRRECPIYRGSSLPSPLVVRRERRVEDLV